MYVKNKNFNSHARVGRDAEHMPVVEEQINFNSHARVGRDNILHTAP